MHSDPVVLPSKRTYNKWVANESMEDFALRFTAIRARRWSISRIAMTALGTTSFLVLEALGGGITLAYGFNNSLAAILVVCSILFLTGIPISVYAAKYGVDIDLLTRGAGFGYLGSTISSLIYASFTFIFFALEAAIMSMAIHLLFGVPLPIAYIISSIVIIPLVVNGIRLISSFQVLTQPVWIFLQLLPLFYIFQHDDVDLSAWVNFGGAENPGVIGFDILLFGSASAILFPLIAQIGEQVDFLRFLPEKTQQNRIRWWTALLAAGPGWTFVGVLKLLIGSLLAYIAFQKGTDITLASDPTHMYRVAFGFVTANPTLSLIIASLFVILCQIKINVANAYAGSLAWSNFFSRLTHYHPGRVIWVVFNVTIALILMELGIYEALENVLQTYSVFVLAWIGALVTDLVINKPLGLSPKHIEFRRSHLYDINPVGVGSMLLASIAGLASHFGMFGITSQALSPFVALFLPVIIAPTIAILTKSKYYLVDRNVPDTEQPLSLTCSICSHDFDREDMASCPAYSASICSLCCSLESQCADQCRKQATVTAQTFSATRALFPHLKLTNPNPALTRFFITLLSTTSVLVGILLLIYTQTSYISTEQQSLSADIFYKVFFLLFILLGIFSWLYVLSQENRRHLLQEAQQKTALLQNEISAHKTTYQHLQDAKLTAESANQAKTRYLAGISHELRTPLNVILGYAQILEQSPDIPAQHRDSLYLVRQNGEHLTDLIEGLLEISKIEAGRLDLQYNEIHLPSLLDQLAEMFRLQAHNKGLTFNYHRSAHLPEHITIDAKRFRQILINILSNAIKYTDRGTVNFTIQYKHQVARFIVEDTGIGIKTDDQQRIFDPFECVSSGSKPTAGTGLGLAIVRLLSELMGGDVTVESNFGVGSTFTMKLALSSVDKKISVAKITQRKITGYAGETKRILIVDDEYQHRNLLSEYLSSLNFDINTADGADSCMLLLANNTPINLFILDVSMPGLSGWQLAEKLRAEGFEQPIIMLSANSQPSLDDRHSALIQAYLSKPVQLNQLLEEIGTNLKIQPIYDSDTNANASTEPQTLQTKSVDSQIIRELIALAEIGFLSALKNKLAAVEEAESMSPEVMARLNLHALSCNFPALIEELRNLDNDA